MKGVDLPAPVHNRLHDKLVHFGLPMLSNNWVLIPSDAVEVLFIEMLVLCEYDHFLVRHSF